MYRTSVLLKLGVLSVGVALTGCGGGQQAPAPPKKAPPPKPGDVLFIKGKASIQLKIKKDSDPLGGLELVLCKPEAAQAVQEARDAGWLKRANPKKFGEGYFNLDLRGTGLAALKFQVARTTANPQGEFSFYDLKEEGDYLMYGQYKSDWAAGYWLVPVTVKKGTVLEIDLNETNMKEIYNRLR